YVELFNAGNAPVELSGWRLSNAVSYTIPNGTVLGSGQYLLISQHPAELAGRYGVQSLGPFDGRLANEGETLELLNAAGVVQDFVDYQLGFPWPTIGDVPGRSIQLVHPALDNELGGSWRSALVTPGAANSVFAFNAPPQMRQVSHSPVAPVSGQDVTITMKVTDPDGVDSVVLQYQLVNPGDYIAITDSRYATNWTSAPMRDDGQGGDAVAGDDVYTGVLPGSLQTHRRLVRYRVRATDELGAAITAPYADDPQPNFAYFVYDAIPDWTGADEPGVTPPVNYSSELLGSVATYHLITTRGAHEDSQFIPDSTRGSGYGGSDYLWHGALVYDGEVYDHVRFRARGGVWRYAMGKNMWKFDFNRGHDFEARDDYGDEYEVGWSKLNLSAIIQQGDFWHRGEQGLFESVGFKMFNLAGVAASNTNFVHFRIVESADENGADQYSGDFQGLYLAVEQLDDNFLEEHDLPDGNLYKMEGGTGVGGIGGESNNQGDYPQVADSSDLISFKTTYQSSPQTADWWRQNFNLDSYYSYRSIVEAIHHYDIGGGKNYFYYHNPETDQWETLPWDIDLTWANNMFGNGNEPFKSRVLAISEFALDYRNRIRELRDLLINVEQVGLIVDEMASFVYTPGQPSLVDADRAMWDYNPILVSSYVNAGKAGHGRFYAGNGGSIPPTGDFGGMMQVLKNYAVTRSNFIDSTILSADEALTPNRPTITYTGDAGFPLNQLQFTSSAYSGRGSTFRAMEWRIGEIYHPGTANYEPGTAWKYEVDAVWESGELGTFNSVLDFSGAGLQVGHTYRARVRMQDAAGRWSHWSTPVEFVAAPPVSVPTLAISEVHYNPYNPALADAQDLEFIEIFNYGNEPVNLSGIQIADFRDDPYVFGGGLSLDAGEYIVVARTPAVFTSVYGPGINLAPTGWGTGNLSNSGETISLLDSAGALIVSVTYSDMSPWPVAADGTGASLEVIDAEGELNDPANWRASQQNGGSPGNNGEPQDLAGDYDSNGAVEPQDHAVWRSQFGMTVAPGSGADGNSNGTVDLADFVIWRKNLGAQAASAGSLAMAAAPISAAAAPKRASTADDGAASRIAGSPTLEPPLRRAPTAGSKFFDGAAKFGVPIQQPTKTELSDLLLRIMDFDARQPADDLSPASDDFEHGASTSPWAVDEAFQDLELDLARSGDPFVSSLAGTRLS
ncbi:MAG TPA: lamin tail domain-containing protein, partial [Lacipirellulaceae bacterium]